MDDHKLQIILAARDVTKSAFLSATGQVKAFTKNIFSLRGAITTLAGTAGLGLFIKTSLETADVIGKTADKLGVTTDSLQEYRHAAKIAGIEQNTLDMALQRFTRRTAEAAAGSGELKGILEQYGIQVKNADGTTRNHEQVLNDLADVIANTQSESERLRIAFKAFDSEGAALVNMLKNGSAGLNQMRRDARDLGIVMDEQLIRQSERANDELEKLTRVLKVQFMSAAVGLAPKIAEIAQHTTDWWKINQKIVTQDVAGWIRGITEAAKIGLWPLRAWADLWRQIGWRSGGGKGTHPGSMFGTDLKFAGAGLSGFGAAGAGAVDLGAGGTSQGGKVTPGFDFDLINKEMAEHSGLIREVTAAQEEFQKAMITSGGTGEIMAAQLRRGVGDSVTAFTEGYNVLENLSQRTAEAMEDNFSSFFKDAFRGELDGAKEYFRAFCYSLTDSFSDMMGQMAKEALFGKGSGGGGFFSSVFSGISSLFSGGGSAYNAADWAATLWHQGGRVGMDSAVRRTVPAHLFAGAPRFHQGLRSDEYPAILQYGETVKKKGSSGGDTHNYYISAVDSKSFSDLARQNKMMIADTVARAMEKKPASRHKLKRLTK